MNTNLSRYRFLSLWSHIRQWSKCYKSEFKEHISCRFKKSKSDWFYWSRDFSIDQAWSIRRIFNQSIIRKSAKISKRKKPITCPFEAQIVIPFFAVFKGHYKLILWGGFQEKRVHLVPPIVHLGFLYPKLSKIFYRQYSLKKLKIWCCRNYCYKIIHSWWFQPLSGISKSQMWVFVCDKFK